MSESSTDEKSFNQLTPPELERLALLVEEMGESLQIIGKILRHGMDSYNPISDDRRTNRELLEKELGDVKHATDRLTEANDLDLSEILMNAEKKRISIRRWLHHQEDKE
jgi:NTP pyrophosphatase (non-canonical NTP hydrolase)